MMSDLAACWSNVLVPETSQGRELHGALSTSAWCWRVNTDAQHESVWVLDHFALIGQAMKLKNTISFAKNKAGPVPLSREPSQSMA